MKDSNKPGADRLERFRSEVASAESIYQEAKGHFEQAKRRRKLAKLLAKRARKKAKLAKARLDQARDGLARAEFAALQQPTRRDEAPRHSRRARSAASASKTRKPRKPSPARRRAAVKPMAGPTDGPLLFPAAVPDNSPAPIPTSPGLPQQSSS